MKKLKPLATLALASVIFMTGCKKDEYQEKTGLCPLVVSTIPADKSVNVPLSQIVSATFNEKMNPATITEESFTLVQGTTQVSGTVSYTAMSAAFAPSIPFAPFTTYTGRVKTLAKDLMNNSLQADYVWSFTTIPEVVLSSLPITSGTTVGAGTFAQGSAVTVIATPLPGFSFLNWTQNGTIVSISSSYQFTMDGNRTLIANFTLQNTVNLSSSPVLGGVTIGSGQYNTGTSVTALATPNAEYNFVNWTENGTIVSTSLSYTFPLSANRTLVANFVLKTYTLIVTATNGTVVKDLNQTAYNSGAIVQLTAIPDIGYTFTGWSGDASGNANPLSVTMNANKNITASYTPILITYTLNVLALNGTVVKNPNQTVYNGGAIVQLTATPGIGYTFTGWSGDASGNANPLSVTMNSNKNITANFTAIPADTYTLNVTAVNGIVLKVPVKTSYNSGEVVVLTATPAAGYTFTNWTGDATGTLNTLSVTMNTNKNITANFTQTVNTYTLNVQALNGTVVKNPNLTTYNSGAIVQLTATPNLGYVFSGWSGDATGSLNPLSVTMNSNKNITANFTAAAGFTLNVNAVNGSVSKNPNMATYTNGTSVVLTATPNSGYTFTGWSGDATGSVSPITVIMNSNKNITANFIVEILPLLGPLAIDLGCVGPFAIIAGSTITSTGPSIINGNVGLSPGSALIGFPPGIINGTKEITTPVAAAAKLCLTSAYNDGQGRSLNAISLPGQLGGLTLAPGLYSNSSTSGISGTGANGILTLDAQGNGNAVWIFQIGSTLTTDPATSIVLSGGAKAANIFWIVGTSATLGTNSVFYGNILADQAITLNTGAVLNGRALARIAAVTLDASTITKP